jgi:hypothetical protein
MKKTTRDVAGLLRQAKIARRQREYQLLRAGRSVNELTVSPLLREPAADGIAEQGKQ